MVVWNLHTGRPVRQIQINATLEGGNPALLPPHTGVVHCIRLSSDGQYLVTGAQDQLVRVWTMPDERLLHTLEGHADDVSLEVPLYDSPFRAAHRHRTVEIRLKQHFSRAG
ncbi:unnamed protein product [Protopolystoma xenopodis]|uniref:Uncharacterized protein n=1 Tax=Protopolystoma xenopodis TaxID=117903 RepID=A0A3S5AZT2_9PLAT|nr:unnamed protein product [Protopolystoma xenopodis]